MRPALRCRSSLGAVPSLFLSLAAASCSLGQGLASRTFSTPVRLLLQDSGSASSPSSCSPSWKARETGAAGRNGDRGPWQEVPQLDAQTVHLEERKTSMGTCSGAADRLSIFGCSGHGVLVYVGPGAQWAELGVWPRIPSGDPKLRWPSPRDLN